MKRFEIMEKFYSSKALLKMAGGGCIPHIPPLDPPLGLNVAVNFRCVCRSFLGSQIAKMFF